MSLRSFVVFNFVRTVYADAAQIGIRRAARESACNLICYTALASVKDYQEIFTQILDVKSEGREGVLMIFPDSAQIGLAGELCASGVPVVLIGRKEESLPSVMPDNEGGIRKMVHHLVAQGHRRIGFVAGIEGNISAEQRFDGYLNGLREAGLESRKEWIIPGKFDSETTYQYLMGHPKLAREFTALICSNDSSATGAMKALLACGLKIPDDIAVTGFDNQHMGKITEPPLTTLNMSGFELGYRAFQLLTELRKDPGHARHVLVPCYVVKRKSCGHGAQRVEGEASAGEGDLRELVSEMKSEIYPQLGQALPEDVDQLIQNLIASCSSFQAFSDALCKSISRLYQLDWYPENGARLWTSIQKLTMALKHRINEAEYARIQSESQKFIIETIFQFYVKQQTSNNFLAMSVKTIGDRIMTCTRLHEVLDALGMRLDGMQLKFHGLLLIDEEKGGQRTVKAPIVRNLSADFRQGELVLSRDKLNICSMLPKGDDPNNSNAAVAYFLNPQQQILGLIILDMDSRYFPYIPDLVRPAAHYLRSTRLLESLEKASADLKRSNVDLQQFAYVASHDLQEPLRMIKGYTQLLAKRYKGKLDADADEFIGYAVDGVSRMQNLINDLLTYSRAGSDTKPFEPILLENAFRSAIENLRFSIESEQARVTHDPLPAVSGNVQDMVQLLQNLIGNSIKYHGPNRPEVHVTARLEKECWIISVRDNGIGIDPQYRERIFHVFQRLHSVQEYSGTGIGLAICRKIVERHGGKIWVESEPGNGATFVFTLPVARNTGGKGLRA